MSVRQPPPVTPALHLLDVPAAAARMARHASFVRRLIAAHEIRIYRIGGRVLLDAADVDALIRASVVEPWPARTDQPRRRSQ
jgi:excisionase family DNA binding protein